jgi:acetolactate synthase-1/3 small subunit
MVEVTGDEDKLNSLLKLLASFGVKEVCRTGRIAMTRGIINETGHKGTKPTDASDEKSK